MRTDQISIVARPYAAAAFAEALSENQVPAWGAMLDAAANITENQSVKVLLGRPGIDPARIARFYCEVLAPLLNEEGARFLALLASYRRLPVLPEIARLYQEKREVFEKKVTVQVISAVALDEPYQKK